MSDDKLKEIAERVVEQNSGYHFAVAPILAAIQQARDLGREEEHAAWLAKAVLNVDLVKAAFERGREEERKALREWTKDLMRYPGHEPEGNALLAALDTLEKESE